MTTFSNGFQYDGSSRLMVVDLAGGAVPNTATFNAGFAFKQSDGSLYVTTDAIASAVYNHGLAFRADGALFVIAGVSTNHVTNYGLPTKTTGEVYISSGGTIDHYNDGFPITSADRLVTT